MPIRLLTAEQAAEILGLHRSRIYTALETGVLKCDFVAGRSKSFKPEALLDVLDALRPFITAEEYDRGIFNLKVNGYGSLGSQGDVRRPTNEEKTPMNQNTNTRTTLNYSAKEMAGLGGFRDIVSAPPPSAAMPAANKPISWRPHFRPIACPPGMQDRSKKLMREMAAITDSVSGTRFLREARASGLWDFFRQDFERCAAANPQWQPPPKRDPREMSPQELGHA